MRLRLSLLLCLLFSAIAIGTTQAYGDERADVRVIDTISGMGIVDVYLNDSYAGQLDFAIGGQFISVTQGTVALRLLTPDSDPSSTPLFTGEFTARDGQVLNVVLSGTSDNIALNSYPVDLSPLDFGMSRVNVIHAIPSLGALTVNVAPANGDLIPLATDLAYGANAQTELPVGLYNFDYVTFPTNQTISAQAGASYTIVLVQSADVAAPINALIFANSVTLDGASGSVRFVNLSASYVALSINGALAADLPSQLNTVYLALEPGSYDVAVYRAEEYGTDAAPLFTSTLDIRENVWQTSVIDGQPDAASIVSYDDDVSVPPDGQVRFTVINVRTDPINFVLDDQVVLQDLQAADVGAVLMTTAPHNLQAQALGESVFTLGDFYVLPDSPFNLRTLVVGTSGTVMLIACSIP